MGAYHALVQELRETDSRGFANFLRMDVESFEILLRRVAPLIARQDTVLRLMPGFQHYVSGVPEPFCRCAVVKFRCYQKIPAVNSVPFVPSTAKICRFRLSVEIGSIPIFSVGPYNCSANQRRPQRHA